MTALDLITDALRLTFVIESGETPTNAEAQDSLRILNQMLNAWTAERLMVFTISIAEYALISGQQTYSLGPGGIFNAARPVKIDRITIVYLANPNQPDELPLVYLTDTQWAAIPVKNIPTTLPIYVYDDGAYPLRNLSFWGIPTVISNIRVYSWTALNQPATLTTTLVYPPAYEEALLYNLAVRLAPNFGEALDPAVAALAVESKARVKSINIPIVDLRCDDSFSDGAYYDWRSDSYVGRNR